MTDVTTAGYEAEPQNVAAEVAAILDGWDDPLARYSAATAAQVHHQAVVEALAAERARIAAALNTQAPDGTRLSFAKIADLFGISRGMAQKLVGRGRRPAG